MKYTNNPVYNYIGLTLVFFTLVILLPANQAVMNTYHLSSHQYHILLFIIELPLTAVWFAAFYGYHRLREYTVSIKDTKEEKVFSLMTKGCQWLAWGLVLPSILSLILNAVADTYHGFYATSIIFDNYFNLIFPLVAFTVIADGAHNLIAQGRVRTTPLSIRGILLIFVTIGTLYCYLTFRHLDLQHLSSSNNPYYLPVWLLIFTITIPYLYVWLIGLLAAYEFSLFAKQVKGIIYRRALQLVALGVVLVVVDSIGVQYLHSVIPRTGHLSLNSMLVATYILYFIIVLGFVLISFGANRLKKIEDI